MNRPQHPFTGVLLAASALLLFAFMDACTKYLTALYPVPIVVAMRYLIHLGLMILLLAPFHSKTLLKINRKKLVWLRGLCLVLVSLFMGLALQRMPLAETTAICFSAPLIVAVLAAPVLQEKIGAIGWLAVLMGFAGVLLVARPGSGLDAWGIVFAFLAAASGATYQMMSRILAPTENASAMLFYGALIGSIIFGLTFPIFWQGTTPTPLDISLFLFMGAAGGFGHYLFTLAFRHAPASMLAPVTYLQLLWALIIGWLIFNTTPDNMSLIGMIIIASSGLLIAFKSRKKSTQT